MGRAVAKVLNGHKRKSIILFFCDCERLYEQAHNDTADDSRYGAYPYGRRAWRRRTAGIGAGSDHGPGPAGWVEEPFALADVFGRLHGAAAQSFETAHAAKCGGTCSAMDFSNRYSRPSRTRD